MNRHAFVLPIVLGFACAGCPPAVEADAGADAGAQVDAAGADTAGHDAAGHDAAQLDAATGDAAGADASLPILQRISTGEYTCNRSHDSTSIDEVQWWGQALLASGSSFFLARGSGDYSSSDLDFSTISLDGTLGTTTPVVTTTTTAVKEPGLVADGDNFALVWSEGDFGSFKLRFARVGSAGQQVTAPHDIAGSTGYLADAPHLFKTGSGFAVIWSSASGYDDGALKFLALDTAGNAVGQPATIFGSSSGSLWSTTAIPIATGFAVAWSFYSVDGQAVYFTTVDAAGAKDFTEKRLSDSGFDGDSPSLIVDGSGFLATWSEYYSNNDYTNPEAWRVVRAAHLDGQGNVVGPRHLLQPSSNLTSDETPLLLDLGSDVALAWSHGTFVVICAGCMPDNKIQLVILDRATLTPKSNVADILNTETMGGLTSPVLARHGLDFLAVYDVTFHVNAIPATGTIHCQ
ncbi:MAG: hypothetical protein JXR83_10310 [Deltaproteobacteria bacterium]|nr:hypothetical protein [Deltaproteobacteria bacterium]